MSVIKKIQSAISEKGLDALLVKGEKNRRYITGFHSSAGMALVTRNAAFFVTDSRYIEAAKNSITSAAVFESTAEKNESAWLKEFIAGYNIKVLGFEADTVSAAAYQALNKAAAGAYEFQPAQEILLNLRASKSETELKYMVAAQRIAEKALDEVLGLIKPGLTERDLAAEISYRMARHGAERNSFDPIVVSGVRSSLPHGEPGDKAIEYGDFVTMDFGCVYQGYCSDMTRTVALGRVSEEMRRVYDTVLRAQLVGIETARAGVTGRDVDAAARKVIKDAGYGEYFGHGFGHGLGLDIHENPSASAREENPLPEGAVISAEPGIYIPQSFGVRIEDVIILRETGAENITKPQKELLIL